MKIAAAVGVGVMLVVVLAGMTFSRDQIVRVVGIESGESRDCSAANLSPELPPQPELPRPTARMRDAVARAAVACDYDELARLALQGDGRFYFEPTEARRQAGGQVSPAPYWRSLEENGGEPLRILVELLRLSYGRSMGFSNSVRGNSDVETPRPGSNEGYYWPRTGSSGWEWAATPDRLRVLERIFGEELIARAKKANSYNGMQAVHISGDGDWYFYAIERTR